MLTNIQAEYFIWHEEKRLVLTRTKSLLCAHAITEGLLNTNIYAHFVQALKGPGSQALQFWNNKLFEPGRVLELDRIKYYLKPYENELSESDKTLIKLAQDRESTLLKLEIQLDQYRRRFYSTYDSGFYHWVGDALKQSDPKSGKFSSGITEFSSITGIDPVATYYDFKMKHDSYALINIKMWAYYEKYKRLINQCYTKEDMEEQLDKCGHEVFYAAST